MELQAITIAVDVATVVLYTGCFCSCNCWGGLALIVLVGVGGALSANPAVPQGPVIPSSS